MSSGRVNLVSGGLANNFLDIYPIHWTCDKNHIFGKDQIGSPTKCSVCESPMFKPIVESRRESESTRRQAEP